MDRFNKITVPAGQKFRQLQKIVHDIKKNDSGLMSKFKKLTSKAPPSVPPVDYVPEHLEEEEQWSDDFDSDDYENPDNHSDSDTYVVPNEDNCDDNYEPPPSEQENKQIPMAFPCSGGEYADNKQPSQQKPWLTAKPLPTLPNQPSPKPVKPTVLPPPAAQRPKLLPKRTDDEADYVVPVDDEEDNYIEPTEESSPQPVKPPVVNRSIKPTARLDPASSAPLPPVPSSASTLDVYEVLKEEEKSSPALTGISKPLAPKPIQRLPGGRPYEQDTAKESPKLDRNVLPLPRQLLPPKVETDSLGIQEVKNHNSKSASEFRFPSVTVPCPFPRITKKLPIPPIPPKSSIPDRDQLIVAEDKPVPAERRRSSTHEIPLPPIPKPLPQKPPAFPRMPEPVNCITVIPRNCIQGGFTIAEQNAGVHGKPWYMASSDRKTAEDALYKSNEDGSFLVRKSSGQDSKQPYTLVVFYNKKVYNIPIRFIEPTRQYALGREKCGEERFDSVAEIIENHQRTSLVLIDSQNNTKDSTKLKHIIRVS